jgi:four helix bundle protein
MQDFTKLRVWASSVELAEHVYRITSNFPRSERYGLSSQMRAAVVSVSSNIAEGAGRRGGADTARFLQIAIGSVCEVDSQARVAQRLGILPEGGGLLEEVNSLRRQLIRLKESVERDLAAP